MNTLIIYDSKFGNTERIAHALATPLSAFGQVRIFHVDHVQAGDIQGADLLILGSPTQGWLPTPTMTACVARIAAARMPTQRIACFDTRFHKARWLTGSAAVRMAKSLRRSGIQALAEPESFFVDTTEGPLESGEVERAGTWALQVHDRYTKAAGGPQQSVTRQHAQVSGDVQPR